MPIINSSEWDDFISGRPEIHLLQTSMWGNLKSQFGWKIARFSSGLSGAQVLIRQLPLGFQIAYIPKGPIGTNWSDLWPEIHAFCRKNKTVFLRVEPDLEESGSKVPVDQLPGFIPVADTIQPRQTILIDISDQPDDWLARMKQKTRYNTRLAEKKEVRVVESRDFDAFDRLMQKTGERDGFGVHTKDYYRAAYEAFEKSGSVALLQAEFEGKPLAMLMVFAHGDRAYYLYGASGDEERQRMPTYLLQFEAMKWASSRGCTVYDLWGIPDATEEELETGFENCSDGLWGVYRFKRGLGGRIYRSVSGFDYVYDPFLYKVIRWRMNHSRGIGAG